MERSLALRELERLTTGTGAIKRAQEGYESLDGSPLKPWQVAEHRNRIARLVLEVTREATRAHASGR